MSGIDLSNIPHKPDLPVGTPSQLGLGPANNPEIYERRKEQLQRRLERRLSNTSSLPLRVRVGFLEESDKNTLISDLESMGYIVDSSNERFIMIS